LKVLLVDDAPDFLLYMKSVLARAGVKVVCAASCEQALAKLRKSKLSGFDAILLDIGLPDRSGLEMLYDLRSAGDETPVIILSGDAETEQKVMGLGLGADDYLVKPVNIEELLARVKTVQRRRKVLAPVHFGELDIDLVQRRVTRLERRVDLNPREFDLLLALVRAQGRVVPRKDLTRQILGPEVDPQTRTLDVYVGRLRRKLDPDGGSLIQSHRGVGYQILERSRH
jgi:two-component system OmpR family response regulator